MLHRDPSKLFPHDYVMRYTFVPLVPRFITPNMITVFRMVLVPFILYFLFYDNFQIGVPLFLFAAFTDALDGSVARLRHQVTEWGTFYDPFADKLLVGSVVILVVMQHINPIFGGLILFVDTMIMIGGYIRKKQGRPMGSNIFGKTKMFFQILGISLLLIALWAGFDLFIPFSVGTFSLAIVLAVISLFTYGL
ncbi:hypothetical protein A3C09_00545 [Candidatus Uhrbacteria bacterium RIFCSPHIGHO2_02_FULL_47_44]|uniref:CDP-diacylglycerol--glycerol-3-phosphate 3-phosphatidyltransferase n=1 Tax=Candidatus Uhrbacteria bacterium RIFCSPLOWO2_02_FULL_48_18 TaxID=1802408 RepID=A0A1F7V8A9_9BACT|nr:MAG: hypothetical protein A3C09_00545 [Candidatus Uhrbacteria bacterium RIFCSPHIGHO2_02_FULL_47_44]OGL76692.1 MAG: hypothetical protein A3E97_02135 [Candidatus Uhrbacteria bacterium RIFCSPHIGHO2_12_FULL_47_12]OGL82585.1 MAG: hypothetical protein A3B20_00065 [Candidatus Uhrbacteria bacterium RIFCSPLOWO2_01_FULL_47_17]OGL86796.1 MAG: hypothetical protein A3I41_04435 [Candidatus Uhrbacteria bacterium RIFCSPLOWO2_02_FULL_48_18]OGL91768.1 MAG: hypothetical protein A3H12_00620 [Candidatus Uhrbacte